VGHPHGQPAGHRGVDDPAGTSDDGLVERVHVTLFPVITGRTGADPIFTGAADFDLEMIESRTLDGRTQELIYRPTLHG
jgi:hypothetical protein